MRLPPAWHKDPDLRRLFTNGPIQDNPPYDKWASTAAFGISLKMDGEGADFKENAWIDAGAEDELSARSKRSWVTPRNSVAGKTSPIPRKPTPYATVGKTLIILKISTDATCLLASTACCNHKETVDTAKTRFKWSTTFSGRKRRTSS